MPEAIVYWLFDDRCLCPWRHGYVGWTMDWKGRLKNHRRKFGDAFQYKFLFRGTRLECRRLEWQLRPTKSIGWNNAPGGGKNRFGIPHSVEVRQRMSEAAHHRPPISDETREKLRITSTGRTNKGRRGQKKSDEECAKISISQAGRKRSAETCAKLSVLKLGNKNRLGKFQSDETKEKIKIKKTGVPIHSDEHKQALAERMKGNAFTKGKPWSAARRMAWLNRQQQEA